MFASNIIFAINRVHTIKLCCPTPDDTSRLGFAIGELVTGGTLIALHGELGAGKTVLVTGLACALGVTDPILSPTFIIVSQHKGRMDLYHVDAFRLNNPDESDLREIGLLELLASPGGSEHERAVCAVEWAERLEPWLPHERIDIHLTHAQSGRTVEVAAEGERFLSLIKELKERAPAGN